MAKTMDLQTWFKVFRRGGAGPQEQPRALVRRGRVLVAWETTRRWRQEGWGDVAASPRSWARPTVGSPPELLEESTAVPAPGSARGTDRASAPRTGPGCSCCAAGPASGTLLEQPQEARAGGEARRLRKAGTEASREKRVPAAPGVWQ